MSRYLVLISVLALYFSCGQEEILRCDLTTAQIDYPVIAHSHNDYERQHPVDDAIRHGFRSIEVDIVYDGTILRVSHDDDHLEAKPALEKMYLIPLVELVKKDSTEIILLVDIKAYSPDLPEVIMSVLAKYQSALVSRDQASVRRGTLQIVLSGDIPRQAIIDQTQYKYLFVDGRLSDLDLGYPSDVVPIISANFKDITQWSGRGEASDRVVSETKAVIDQVQSAGKRIRFWNTPDQEAAWLMLIDLGVDMIGVDDIDHFCAVMQKHGYVR